MWQGQVMGLLRWQVSQPNVTPATDLTLDEQQAL